MNGMTAYRKKILRTVLMVLPVFMAYICRMINMPRETPFLSLTIVRSILYILAFSTWTVLIYVRIVQKNTRWYLTFAAGLMVFWILIRTLKFLLPEEHVLVHWFWYLFYLPLIYIPLFTLFVSCSICRKEDFRIPFRLRILYAPAAVLFLSVLTNDLHHLVFVFPPDGPKYPVEGYGYGPVYYVIACWIVCCFTGVVVSVFLRNRMADRTRRILYPVVILGMLAVYSFLYFINNPFVYFWLGDFTIVFCLFFFVFYESLFRLNLIRNNTRYSELFRCSSVPAVIVDENYVEEVRTAAYTELPGDIMRRTEAEPVIRNDGIRLSSAPIRNGRVLWEEDVSGLLALNEKLESVRLDIEEQNTAELEVYRSEYRRRQLVEKNRLYDRLQEKTRDKVQMLSDLLEELEKTDSPAREKQLLLRISVIGAYIKRRNNLSFLSEDREQFPPGELKNCTEQSLEALTLFGIEAEQAFGLKKDMHIENTIRLYEACEEAVEYGLDTLSELALIFSEKENGILMTIRLCSEADFSGFSAEGMSVRREGDGEWFLSCFVEYGGKGM